MIKTVCHHYEKGTLAKMTREEIVFTTKAEAEKKLLELRGKKEAQDERMG